MGSSKMDSSAVYTLFEELKQKIDELDKNATSNNQTDSTFDIDEIISLDEELKVQINQQRFSPEQIKNLGQISTYSINKVNVHFCQAIAKLKSAIKSIDEKINQIKSQQNMIIRIEHVFSIDFRSSKVALTTISIAYFLLGQYLAT